MFLTSIKRQLIGTLNLSIPLIIFYNFFPMFVLSYGGIIICSIMVGAYLMYISYNTTRNQADNLKFVPTGDYLQMLNTYMAQCGFDHHAVNVRYAYVDDGVAMTMFNTIVIDPMLWKDFEGDTEFIKAQDIIETHVIPSLSESKKRLHAHLKSALSSSAQRFIFKHELGHVLYNDSVKRIIVIGIIGALATCAGLLTVKKTITLLGELQALIVGVLIGTIIDLLISYMINVFFKTRAEKNADLFACRYSTQEEINAAADFFEKHEYYAREYRKSVGGLIAYMPVMLMGHIDGITRAQYLRNYRS